MSPVRLWFSLRGRLPLILRKSYFSLWCLLFLFSLYAFPFSQMPCREQSVVSGSGGCRVCVPPVQAYLVLNITNKDDNTAVSLTPNTWNVPILMHPVVAGISDEIKLNDINQQWQTADDCVSLLVQEEGLSNSTAMSSGQMDVGLLTICPCLGCGVEGWRKDNFTNDPLWKSVRAARSRIHCLFNYECIFVTFATV